MANKIIVKKSSVAGKVPVAGDLDVGELAVNVTDQKIYSKNASGAVVVLGSGTGGTGDVVGPSSSTDNALARFDGTTGKLIQNGTITQDDTGNLAGILSEQYNTTTTPPTIVEGLEAWDSGNGTLEVGLKGGNVTYKYGQQEFVRAYNGSGSAMTKGQVVYIVGAQGNRVDVRLAKADAESTSANTIGFVVESIANGAEGWVQVSGSLYKLDTSTLTAGQTLYLSPATAGAYTTTRPTAPNHTVILGFVQRVSATVGSLYVKVDNGYELDELHNVLITSAASGNTLIYDASAGVWKNANLTAGTGISVTNGAGSITIANTGVTSVATGTGLTGGTITTTGTISLANTGVTAGSYTNVNLTVDAQGRITAASNGSAGGVSSFNTRTGAVTLTSGDVTGALGYTPYNAGGNTVLTSANYSSYAVPTASTAYTSGFWMFNNMGNNHGTYTDANNIPGFGVYYLQGTTNGPGNGNTQWYGMTLGLGADYAYSSYACQFAIPRTPLAGNPYLAVRYRENGSWGGWSKIYAGYADSAGSASTASNPASGGSFLTTNNYTSYALERAFAYYNAAYAQGSSSIYTGRSVPYYGSYTYNCYGDPNAPSYYFCGQGFGNGASGAGEIGVNWVSGTGGGLWYRSLRDCCTNWSGWARVIDEYNYAGYVAAVTTGGNNIGSYIFAICAYGATRDFGVTVDYTNIYPAAISTYGQAGQGEWASPYGRISGTWKCMGYSYQFGTGWPTSLWVRVA